MTTPTINRRFNSAAPPRLGETAPLCAVAARRHCRKSIMRKNDS
jgi:hypothetical protein